MSSTESDGWALIGKGAAALIVVAVFGGAAFAGWNMTFNAGVDSRNYEVMDLKNKVIDVERDNNLLLRAVIKSNSIELVSAQVVCVTESGPRMMSTGEPCEGIKLIRNPEGFKIATR